MILYPPKAESLLMSFLDNLTAQLPFSKKTDTAEYFFALNIGLSEVTSVVWSLYGNNLDILGEATLPYKGTEELVEKSYKVLDESLGALEIEPEKILFGVPDSWGIDDNLKEPYLKLLRRMLKEYDLQPMAYVTTTNAISHFLQKQEGVPPTAILLGLGEFVEVALMRGGKVVEVRSTERGNHLFDDVEKVLSQFTSVEVLPSKILLYPLKIGEDLDKIKDELMSYPWMQKLSFLHFPKIDILDEDISPKAIVYAGASEISPHVDIKHSFASMKKEVSSKESLQQTKTLKKEEEAIDHPLPEEEGDFGFVKGDIAEKEKGKEDEEAENLEDDNLVSPDIEEEDILPTQRRPLKRMSSRNTENNWQEQVSDIGDDLATSSNLALSAVQKNFLSPFNKSLGKLSKSSGVWGKLLIIPAVLILLGAAYLFLIKASVTVYVESRVLEKGTEVSADPKATTVDELKKVIPASIVETTVSGSDKAQATGTKQIGDPAKGKAVIYNKTSGPKTFGQGTVLVGPNNLKFTLDSSVTIASQSAVEGGIAFGKSTVPITASVIGPDSNLLGSTSMTVSGQQSSSFEAKVDEALSGGTSKDVTVVTSDDQKKLQAKVLDALRQKAVEDIQGKLSPDKKIISEALAVVDGKYNFNKQINDQTGEFSLSANVRFKGTAYSDNDLRTIIAKLVETNMPEGFQLNLQDTETQAEVERVEKDGRLIFQAKFKAKLQPKFDIEALKKQMKGKSVDDVVNELKGLENVVGSDIVFTPSVPTQLARFPLLEQNISVTITPK